MSDAFILSEGEYSDCRDLGVYSTLEGAQRAAHDRSARTVAWVDTYQSGHKADDVWWSRDADGKETGFTIQRFELDGAAR